MGRSTVLRLATVVLVAAVAACGSDRTPADVTPDPQSTSARDGRFEVVFTIDRTTLKPGDDISGTAELWLRAGSSGAISGPSNMFGFEFVEVGGEHRTVYPAFGGDCSPHQVGTDRPTSSEIFKSGADDGTPATAFARDFLRAEGVHLPAGDWDVTAIVRFNDAPSCGGLAHEVRATIRVKVNPGG